MDQDLAFTQNVDTLFSNLEEFTKKESVLGTPVTYGDKTLIPVMSVTLGYGSAAMTSKGQQTATMMNPGNGLGLGAKISTDAVVVIDKDNVSMLTINAASNATSMMDKLPQMLSSLKGGQQSQQGQQGQQGQQEQQNNQQQ